MSSIEPDATTAAAAAAAAGAVDDVVDPASSAPDDGVTGAASAAAATTTAATTNQDSAAAANDDEDGKVEGSSREQAQGCYVPRVRGGRVPVPTKPRAVTIETSWNELRRRRGISADNAGDFTKVG